MKITVLLVKRLLHIFQLCKCNYNLSDDLLNNDKAVKTPSLFIPDQFR